MFSRFFLNFSRQIKVVKMTLCFQDFSQLFSSSHSFKKYLKLCFHEFFYNFSRQIKVVNMTLCFHDFLSTFLVKSKLCFHDYFLKFSRQNEVVNIKVVFSRFFHNFSGGMFALKKISLEFDEMKPKQRKKNVKRFDGPNWLIKKLECHYSVKWQWTN